MIEREGELMTLWCDTPGCEGELGYDEEFETVIERAKYDGWKIRNKDGVWYHFCPECAE